MSNPTAPRSPLLWCTAVAVVAMAACGEAQKPGDAKPGVVQTAGKDGLSESLLAGELATAMVSGEGEKGVSSIGPGQSLQGTLANGDGKLDSGSYFDSWVFVLGEAADVSISMTSSDIDTYLSLYRGGPGSMGEYRGGLGSMGEYLGGDDDGGGRHELASRREPQNGHVLRGGAQLPRWGDRCLQYLARDIRSRRRRCRWRPDPQAWADDERSAAGRRRYFRARQKLRGLELHRRGG